MKRSLATAAGLGFVSGLRSMQGLAWVSRDLSSRRVPRRAGRLERWLARDDVALLLTAGAVGELAVDKLPGIPDRIAPPPLLGRAAAGGVVGAVAAGRGQEAVGATLGAVAAVAGTFAGWFVRREAGRRTGLPDAVLALVEDAVAIASARELVEG